LPALACGGWIAWIHVLAGMMFGVMLKIRLSACSGGLKMRTRRQGNTLEVKSLLKNRVAICHRPYSPAVIYLTRIFGHQKFKTHGIF
jgi:hypothetical protein